MSYNDYKNEDERNKLIRHMLDALDIPSKPLTKWEESFISSVTDQFERRGNLTEKQFDIVEKIYAEKTE